MPSMLDIYRITISTVKTVVGLFDILRCSVSKPEV